MGNKKYQDIVIESIRKIERQAETILKSIPHVKRKSILERETEQDMIAFANTSTKNTVRAKALENILLQQQVVAATYIMHLLKQFSEQDLSEAIEKEDPWILSDAMLFIGELNCLMNQSSIATSKEFHEMIHAKMVDLKRYGMDREDYALAEQEAEDYWKRGGIETHDVVAKRLAKKHRVNRNGLKRRLAKIAVKYGRCFGLPGVKKTP